MERFFARYHGDVVQTKASCDASNTDGIRDLLSAGYKEVNQEVFDCLEVQNTEEPRENSVWDELDAAYTAGYQEGVDNV